MATNVIPFRSPADKKAAYNPGVPAFDPSNPAHIAAWNAMFAMGQAERNARDAGRL